MPQKTWAEWLAEHKRNFYENGDDRYPDALRMIWRQGRLQGWPDVSMNPQVQAEYFAMRIDQVQHKLAEMLALSAPPMSRSDKEFLEGHCNGNQFEKTPILGDAYAAEARAQGVDITGKVYIGGLASYPGDPTAWVAGRGDVERVARDKGMNVEGLVTVKSAPRDPAPEVGVADDLVSQALESRLEQNPGLAFRDQGELRHEVRESIKPAWAA